MPLPSLGRRWITLMLNTNWQDLIFLHFCPCWATSVHQIESVYHGDVLFCIDLCAGVGHCWYQVKDSCCVGGVEEIKFRTLIVSEEDLSHWWSCCSFHRWPYIRWKDARVTHRLSTIHMLLLLLSSSITKIYLQKLMILSASLTIWLI